MRVCILDFDGSLDSQRALWRAYDPIVVPLRDWGPSLRIACSHARFQRLQRLLSERNRQQAGRSRVHLYGSGDYHHITLALLRALSRPCNLLVLDNHPDWMRGLPFLHCGTWLHHAARLPNILRVYHVGGDVDFDNAYGWLAPWDLLNCGKIRVFPARREFRGRRWSRVCHAPLRGADDSACTLAKLRELIRPYRSELANNPLYISIDKDVLQSAEATVNWDSGPLTLQDAEPLLRAFIEAANGDLAGVDVLGDWSPVRTTGMVRRFLHHTHHRSIRVNPMAAAQLNERANVALLDTIFQTANSIRGKAA